MVLAGSRRNPRYHGGIPPRPTRHVNRSQRDILVNVPAPLRIVQLCMQYCHNIRNLINVISTAAVNVRVRYKFAPLYLFVGLRAIDVTPTHHLRTFFFLCRLAVVPTS